MTLRSLIPWRGQSWSPATRDGDFDPFVSMRREMDRVFDNVFGALDRPSRGPVDGWQTVSPAVDIAETETEIVVIAELPGLDEKDFELTLSGDVLTLKGEKKSEQEREDGGSHYVERRYGSFQRLVRLPFAASEDNVHANYDKGVLTVHVPKPAEARNAVRRIPVKSA
jgi:HSP20 family protein